MMQAEYRFIDGRWQLPLINEDYRVSRTIAAGCEAYLPDDEDEQVDDVPRSCVNCAYRRWLVQAIECTSPLQGKR